MHSITKAVLFVNIRRRKTSFDMGDRSGILSLLARANLCRRLECQGADKQRKGEPKLHAPCGYTPCEQQKSKAQSLA